MAKKYGINAQVPAGMNQTFGEIPAQGIPFGGVVIPTNPFLCCGLTTLAGLSVGIDLRQFEERAAFLAALWNINQGKTHHVYVVNQSQDGDTTSVHSALRECGAKVICEFPNLQPYHNRNNLKMYMVNLNDGIGKFFDEQGRAYVKPPEVTHNKETGATIKVPDASAPVAAPVKASRKAAVPRKETA